MTDSSVAPAAEGLPLDGAPPEGVTARARSDAGEGEGLDTRDGGGSSPPADDLGAEVVDAWELARRALAGARAGLPAAFPVVWRDGRDGPADVVRYGVEGRGGASALEALRADLAAELARPWPKGARGARVLYPCEVTAHGELPQGAHAWQGAPADAPRTTLARDEVTAAVFLAVDADDGAGPLREPLELLRAAGVAALAHPSASAEVTHDPLDATRWRILVPLAQGTTRGAFVRHRRALPALLRALGWRIDAGTLRPETASYVAPRPERGPRPGSHALRLDGAALDLVALDAGAVGAGWRAPGDAERDAGAEREGFGAARPRDFSALFRILEVHGVVGAPVGARGLRRVHCPRERWHSGGGPARRDTSAVAHPAEGWALCSHEHSGAPDGERGPATLARLVAWCVEDLRAVGRENEAAEVAAELYDVRQGGALDAAREALARPPFGEAPRREVQREAVREDLLELARHACRERDGAGSAVLYTPSTGAGKSTGVVATVYVLLRDGTLTGPREGERAEKASATHVVRTVDDARAAVETFVRGGVRAAAYYPVHAHPAGCLHRERAAEVYAAGASARAVVCNDIPGPEDSDGHGAGERCERYDTCAARSRPFVPFAAHVEGRRLPTVRAGVDAAPVPLGASVGPDLDALAPGEPWVAVATHASAGTLPLRADALAIVDESDVALAELARVVTACVDDGSTRDPHAGDGTTLGDARAWARGLRRARCGEGSPEPRAQTDAARVVARIILDALDAHAREHGHAALHLIPDPVAWCVEALRRRIARMRRDSGGRAELALLHPQGAHASPDDLARRAHAWWCAFRGTKARRDRRPFRDAFGAVVWTRAPYPARGGEAFAALHRWTRGEVVALPYYPRGEVDDGGELAPVGTVLAHRSVTAGVVAALLQPTEAGTRGAVLCLDATGDPGVTERAVRGPVDHRPVIVPDAADTARVLLRAGSVTRGALCPGGAVRWEKVTPHLEAAREALRQRGDLVPDDGELAPVVCFTFQRIAAQLGAVVRAEGLPGAAGDATDADREAAEGVPADVRALVCDLAREGWRWSYYGATDARGSNTWRHARAVVTVGDPRPSGDAMRVRAAWARWWERARAAGGPVDLVLPPGGVEALTHGARDLGARMAAAELTQCHGRARTVQRAGERVALVHVGSIAPLDWHQRAEGDVVVASAAALARGARMRAEVRREVVDGEALPRVESLTLATPAPAPADAPPDSATARVSRALAVLAAQGHTPATIAHALRENPRHVAAWWEGRRPRRETRCTGPRLAALEALAGGEGEASVRAWYAATLPGRGVEAVTREVRALLQRAVPGLTLDAAAFAAWLERASAPRRLDASTPGAAARRASSPRALRPDVLAALAQLLPAVLAALPPRAGATPPGPLPASLSREVVDARGPGLVRAAGRALVHFTVRDRDGEVRPAWCLASALASRGPVRPLAAGELAREAAPLDGPAPALPAPADVARERDAAAARDRAARASRLARAVGEMSRELRAHPAAARVPAPPRDVAAGAERDGPDG